MYTVRRRLGTNGLPRTTYPLSVGFPSSSNIFGDTPGNGLPATVGMNGPIPGREFMTVAPVSVCHHVSMIGHLPPPTFSKYHIQES